MAKRNASASDAEDAATEIAQAELEVAEAELDQKRAELDQKRKKLQLLQHQAARKGTVFDPPVPETTGSEACGEVSEKKGKTYVCVNCDGFFYKSSVRICNEIPPMLFRNRFGSNAFEAVL